MLQLASPLELRPPCVTNRLVLLKEYAEYNTFTQR